MTEVPSPEPVLVSACLLGLACRFDACAAKDTARAGLAAALAELGDIEVVGFCPEQAGGLATPRPPAWIEADSAAAVLRGEDRVVTEAGADVTAAFVNGAEAALAVAKERGIRRAILKERSPSCGVARTHVDGALAEGPGVTAQLLGDAGLSVRGV
ncbi:MAG: DUF523 domain-containing protein [Planctomycetota bacterium]|nr:DUF523 domain-containing protein [Planctomycetota bacterium]